MRKAKQPGAKSDQIIDTAKDTGAAAALARQEQEELRCYQLKGELETKLADLPEPALNAPAEVRQLFDVQKSRLEGDLIFALKRWNEASKSVRALDQSVSPERREGEKVPVAEAQEWFAQLLLSIRLAVEQVVIADAQSAALCESPEAFYAASAANYRAAVESALQAARRDGVLPGWCL